MQQHALLMTWFVLAAPESDFSQLLLFERQGALSSKPTTSCDLTLGSDALQTERQKEVKIPPFTVMASQMSKWTCARSQVGANLEVVMFLGSFSVQRMRSSVRFFQSRSILESSRHIEVRHMVAFRIFNRLMIKMY